MTAPTKPAPYTLNATGRDWVFTPAAVDALQRAGKSPTTVAIIFATDAVKLQAGLTTVTGIASKTLLVRRHGRRVTVDAKDEGKE